MTSQTAVAIAVVVLPMVVLGVITAVAARRRGIGLALAVLSGLVFPVTWAIWYVRDRQRASA